MTDPTRNETTKEENEDGLMVGGSTPPDTIPPGRSDGAHAAGTATDRRREPTPTRKDRS
jgi:hypothetical protein